MLKRYEYNGFIYQWEEGMQPKSAKEVKPEPKEEPKPEPEKAEEPEVEVKEVRPRNKAARKAAK